MTTILLTTVMDTFGMAMNLMLQGMAGIFVFMLVFYLLIYGLEKIFKQKEEK